MSVFLFILANNVIPISVLIILGYFMGKKFQLNIFTLTKLNFYIFVPSFTFVNLYTTKMPLEMIKVAIATVLILMTNLGISKIISRVRGYSEGFKNAFANSLMFYNCGNIGVPLITLVFSSNPFIINGEKPYLDVALTTQIMILVVQNITTNTFGFMNAGRANSNWRESFLKILRMPTIYAVPLAFILKAVPYDITQIPLWPAVKYASNALVPIALITLGVQLTRTAIEVKDREVYLSSFIRLFGGPVFAIILIYFLKIHGVSAQVLMISAALPTAVNSALIAVEYDNHPNFASQAVMTSTLLSSITLVFIIYIARILFSIS